MPSPGTLHVVATPLGNLDDLTPRAVEVLRSVGLVACEDTRRTRRLLERFGIRPPRVISCHRFNERKQARTIVRALEEGTSVALVSDGGTPGVSDPGSPVVAAAFEAGLRVSPVPGPSAVTAAVSVCGFNATGFVFGGFLPSKGAPRRRAIEALVGEERPVVLFEAPHRIARTAADLTGALGDRPVTLLREMTKLHEEVGLTTLGALAASLADEAKGRGEYTLVIAGGPATKTVKEVPDSELKRKYARLLRKGQDPKEAIRTLTRETGMTRREVYRIVRG